LVNWGRLQAVPGPSVTVVGVGAEGWAGLSPAAQSAVHDGEIVLGSARQLALLPTGLGAVREAWPTPLLPALQRVLEAHADQRIVVLASGDPMFFGIGSTLVHLLGAAAVDVLPHPSSVSLACARLGWPAEDVEVVSAAGRPLAELHPAIQPGRRVLVLVSETDATASVCAMLCLRGFGSSPVATLEQLGGPAERVSRATAATWAGGAHDRLAIVAFECRADAEARPLPRTPGLPDGAFDHDGQLTKREIRAVVLAALAPVPGQLLWDVGAGAGSVGIEWMRIHPTSRAVAVEPREDRRARIATNAEALGVPRLRIVGGAAPDALVDLPVPDAVFVGGGVSVPGVIDACLAALTTGGRLVANAVTLETEVVLAGWYARVGGTLTRISVQRAEPIGAFTGWRPAMPVTQWSYTKEDQ
jgi:precorrin-6B C5,15-methyltransferase / cobalt-precorrin-6B C5,C15-methyltransferase